MLSTNSKPSYSPLPISAKKKQSPLQTRHWSPPPTATTSSAKNQSPRKRRSSNPREFLLHERTPLLLRSANTTTTTTTTTTSTSTFSAGFHDHNHNHNHEHYNNTQHNKQIMGDVQLTPGYSQVATTTSALQDCSEDDAFCGDDAMVIDEEDRPSISIWLAWTLLILAIVLEVIATVCMKLSDGFRNFIPSVLVYVFYGLSFVSFPLALQVIELSTAYAIWSGLGTVLTALIGILCFQDTVNGTKMIALLTIMGGCVAIKYADGLQEAAEEAAAAAAAAIDKIDDDNLDLDLDSGNQ